MGRVRTTNGALIIFMMPLAVLAGDLPDTFSLGKYVPQDAWMYMHEVHNPERDFIAQHWSQVWRALADSGIETEITNLIGASMDEARRAEVEAKWKVIRTAVVAVPWGKLGEREFVYAQRFSLPVPNHMFLSRSSAESAEALAKSLKELLEAGAGLSESCKVVESQRDGATVWSLHCADAPILLEIFRKGEIVGVCTGKRGTDDILALMSGRSGRRSVVQTASFRKAVASIERPEDSLGYCQWTKFFHQVKQLIETATDKAKENEDVNLFKRVVFNALDQFAIVDYMVWSRHTNGLQEKTVHLTRLRPECADKPLARALIERKQFEKFDRYVPVDATAFSVTTFIDLGVVYNATIDFIKTELPEGPDMIARWDGIREGFGFDPNRDIFSWLSGEMISVSLPGAMAAQSRGVLMIRTRNPQLAAEKVNTVIDKLAMFAGEQLIIAEAPEVKAEGFRSIFHPLMMMLQIKPVVGVHEDWLIIGATPQSVNQCLAAASGKISTFRHNERFKREGLSIDGKVYSASFTDLSNLGQSLAMGCAMPGMWAAFIPDKKETRPIKAAFAILGKLAPVVVEIDFFNSKASVCRRSGDTFISEMVVTYKPFVEETDVDIIDVEVQYITPKDK